MERSLVQLYAFAHMMRRHPTPMERKLWMRLRANRMGTCFRRQFVLAPFIVDFYSNELHLAVEVDGPIHRRQRAYDARRSEYLRSRYGVRIVRVSNHEVQWHLMKADVRIRRAVRVARSAVRRASRRT